MLFHSDKTERLSLSRHDTTHPLAACSKHSIELDDAVWPSVEHYYQAMKYNDMAYRERIRTSGHPSEASKLGKSKKHDRRKDWDRIKSIIMTRGIYIKCRSHAEVAAALLATGNMVILETSQYDYFWGCGRDQRGMNMYGKVLMNVREQLRKEQSD